MKPLWQEAHVAPSVQLAQPGEQLWQEVMFKKVSMLQLHSPF
jgi:hypothetical protein